MKTLCTNSMKLHDSHRRIVPKPLFMIREAGEGFRASFNVDAPQTNRTAAEKIFDRFIEVDSPLQVLELANLGTHTFVPD